VQTLPVCHLANLTSLIGSIYVASAESSNDSIYNMSSLSEKKFSLLFSKEEKNVLKILLFSQGELLFFELFK